MVMHYKHTYVATLNFCGYKINIHTLPDKALIMAQDEL